MLKVAKMVSYLMVGNVDVRTTSSGAQVVVAKVFTRPDFGFNLEYWKGEGEQPLFDALASAVKGSRLIGEVKPRSLIPFTRTRGDTSKPGWNLTVQPWILANRPQISVVPGAWDDEFEGYMRPEIVANLLANDTEDKRLQVEMPEIRGEPTPAAEFYLDLTERVNDPVAGWQAKAGAPVLRFQVQAYQRQATQLAGAPSGLPVQVFSDHLGVHSWYNQGDGSLHAVFSVKARLVNILDRSFKPDEALLPEGVQVYQSPNGHTVVPQQPEPEEEIPF
jgi:hypothetical protein